MKKTLLITFSLLPFLASACVFNITAELAADFTPSGSCYGEIIDAKQKMKNERYILEKDMTVRLEPSGHCKLTTKDHVNNKRTMSIAIQTDYNTCYARVESSNGLCATKKIRGGYNPKVDITIKPGNCSGSGHLYTLD